jgi:hypothetical protein
MEMNEMTCKARLDALHYAGLHAQNDGATEQVLERAERYFVFLTKTPERPPSAIREVS